MTLNDYVSTHYTEIIKAAKQVAPSHAEDLAHEVILQVYDQDARKVQDLVDTGDLKFWIIKMMLRNYRSKTSPWHYKYRKDEIRRRQLAHWIKAWSEPGSYEHRREKMLQTIDEALAEVPWFDAAVFSIYYEEGHSLNSLAKSTGISRHTLHSSIKKCREHIKKKI